MKEIWIPIDGCEKICAVSNMGRLRRFNKRTHRHEITQFKENSVYPSFGIGFGKNKYLHVTVLETFVGPRPKGYFACHNDGNPRNNQLDNLRWDSPRENTLDYFKHRIIKLKKLPKNKKISNDDVIKIQSYFGPYRRKPLKSVICIMFGISVSTLNKILKNKKI